MVRPAQNVNMGDFFEALFRGEQDNRRGYVRPDDINLPFDRPTQQIGNGHFNQAKNDFEHRFTKIANGRLTYNNEDIEEGGDWFFSSVGSLFGYCGKIAEMAVPVIGAAVFAAESIEKRIGSRSLVQPAALAAGVASAAATIYSVSQERPPALTVKNESEEIKARWILTDGFVRKGYLDSWVYANKTENGVLKVDLEGLNIEMVDPDKANLLDYLKARLGIDDVYALCRVLIKHRLLTPTDSEGKLPDITEEEIKFYQLLSHSLAVRQFVDVEFSRENIDDYVIRLKLEKQAAVASLVSQIAAELDREFNSADDVSDETSEHRKGDRIGAGRQAAFDWKNANQILQKAQSGSKAMTGVSVGVRRSEILEKDYYPFAAAAFSLFCSLYHKANSVQVEDRPLMERIFSRDEWVKEKNRFFSLFSATLPPYYNALKNNQVRDFYSF